MAQETRLNVAELSKDRSRRALLKGTALGVAALAAQLLGRPLVARAADGDPVLLGRLNTEESTTIIQNVRQSIRALIVRAAGAAAVEGDDLAGGIGVLGTTNQQAGNSFRTGVYGANTNSTGSFGTGIFGTSANQRGNGLIAACDPGVDAWGVAGFSKQGIGVYADGGTAGVQGFSKSGPGVQAQGATNGAEGSTGNGAGSGVSGANSGGGFGVSGTTNQTAGDSFRTGVYGANVSPAGSFGSGIFGRSLSQRGNGVIGACHPGTDAWGVAGFSNQGVGVHAEGGTAGAQGSSKSGPGVQGSGATNGVEGSTANGTASGVTGDNSGGGFGVSGTTNQASGDSFHTGVYGANQSAAGSFGTGIFGKSVSQRGNGVIGSANTGADAWGVAGFSRDGVGAYAEGGTAGLQGVGKSGPGVQGSGATNGVEGSTANAGASGVYGANSGGGFGVAGVTNQAGGNSFLTGVFGVNNNNKGSFGSGILGKSLSQRGNGVIGSCDPGKDSWGVAGLSRQGVGVFGQGGTLAGQFVGDVQVTGTLSKGGGSFKIDHPLDPANKYLYHSFVESPDMLNVYSGTVTLDRHGRATVRLPNWFQPLNRDVRYQLTPIGAAAPNLHIASEVAENTFGIGGGHSGLKVSWQITGVRRDAFAERHRIPVEQNKAPEDRGRYLHPLEHGKPLSAMIGAAKLATVNGEAPDPGRLAGPPLSEAKRAVLARQEQVDPLGGQFHTPGEDKVASSNDDKGANPLPAEFSGPGEDKQRAVAGGGNVTG